jgi:hypothetical protein
MREMGVCGRYTSSVVDHRHYWGGCCSEGEQGENAMGVGSSGGDLRGCGMRCWLMRVRESGPGWNAHSSLLSGSLGGGLPYLGLLSAGSVE